MGNEDLSADRPLSDPSEDRLGYAPFARYLADSIVQRDLGDGLVIALYGAWGLGKTTALNFVLHYIKQRPEAERPAIIHFKPVVVW